MSNSSSLDPELLAMDSIMKALSSLGDDNAAKSRVLAWAMQKLEIELPHSKREAERGEPLGGDTPRNKREGTINTVAHKLNANSARKLLEAAATYLTLYQGKETFTRDELFACAKDARYWKADYMSQTSVNVRRMEEAGFLFEKSKNLYSISAESLAEMESQLA